MPLLYLLFSWIVNFVHGGNIDNEELSKPNIVFILADDLGWANLQYHNDNGEIFTPNIDYLVKNGIELNRHYVHYVCSPTRSSLQSGRLPVHCNLSNNPARTNIYNGIPINYTCIAERLKYDANYKCHQIGKWDAGSTVMEQIPVGRGYDTSFGYLNHWNDYWYEGNSFCNTTNGNNTKTINIIDFWETDHPANKYNNTIYEEFQFAQRIYDLIDNATNTDNPDANQPFFIFYASHIGHSPIQIPKEYLSMFENDENLCRFENKNGRTGNPVYPGFNTSAENWHCRSIYQSMINLLDIIIGNITQRLKANNLYNNTLIIFSADNGGMEALNETGSNNFPLRGSKTTPFEGGIRGAAFISGGYLAQHRRGLIINEMMHIADWYSTILEGILGIDPTDKRAEKAGLPPIDSMNMWPLIIGINETSPRIEIPVDKHTLIQRQYKFINNTNVRYASWGNKIYPNSTSPQNQLIQETLLNCSNGCLFDVVNDFTEHNNIINENMQIAIDMNQRLNELKTKYYTNNEKGKSSMCPSNITMSCQCWTAINVYDGFWGPSMTV